MKKTKNKSHLQNWSLLRSHDLQSFHHQPAAFVVLDVCPNLSCHSGVAITVQEIILQNQMYERFINIAAF